MLVRNWMQQNPIVIGSDTLVHEAKQIITDKNLHGLPVVDDGRLRGLITRAICLRAAHYVLRTQNSDELNYFSNCVKVKDLMVRNPVTIQASDTMEHCLEVGIQHGVAQLPVMEGERIVGILDESDVLLHVYGDESRFGDPARAAMVQRLDKVSVNAPIEALLPVFDRGHVAIVMEGGDFLGLITRIDLLDYLRQKLG